jgi:hypothetical protein
MSKAAPSSSSSSSSSSGIGSVWPWIGAAVLGGALVARHFWSKSGPIRTQSAADRYADRKDFFKGVKTLPTVVGAPEVFTHFLKYVPKTPAQSELEKAIAGHEHARMASSPDEAHFLAWLLHTTRARTVVEVGVFMGSTTLAMAQALPEDGRIFALDVSDEFTAYGRKAWTSAGLAHKIDLRIAPATASLQKLIDDGYEGKVDFCFIDANKDEYGTRHAASRVCVVGADPSSLHRVRSRSTT